MATNLVINGCTSIGVNYIGGKYVGGYEQILVDILMIAINDYW